MRGLKGFDIQTIWGGFTGTLLGLFEKVFKEGWWLYILIGAVVFFVLAILRG